MIHIKTDRFATRILVEAGLLRRAAEHLAGLMRSGDVMVVTDANVAGTHADTVRRSLASAGIEPLMHVIEPGEQSKSLAGASAAFDAMASAGFGRDAQIVAVGGGVVGDLAGFIAATWMRGVRWVNCPTTLEADIDASVGGKTGINHADRKNLVGAFHHPELVLIDPEALGTLSDRDMRAGMAESIKHALIADEAFLDWQVDRADEIMARRADTLGALISRNVRIKGSVVERDEREQSGHRAMLNFGHTVGHAVEAMLAYELRHGECVAIGMWAACAMSVHRGELDQGAADRVRAALAAFGLPTSLPRPVPASDIRAAMTADKKAAQRRLRFVLLSKIGESWLTDDVDEATISAGLAAIGAGA